MANSHVETDLRNIARDAGASVANQSDHQTANRLNREVTNFMHDHKTEADRHALLQTLRGSGATDKQINSLAHAGFPTPTLFESSDANPSPLKVEQNPAPFEQKSAPMSAADVVSEVNQVEGNFNRTSETKGAPEAQEALKKALHDVQKYCTEHTAEESRKLVSELAAAGHLPQLAVAALDERTQGLPINDLLTKGQAVNLLKDGTALGEGLAKAMAQGFSSNDKDGTNPANFWGRGFADDIGRPGNESHLSLRHLRMDLMKHFDRPPVDHNQGESLWERLFG